MDSEDIVELAEDLQAAGLSIGVDTLLRMTQLSAQIALPAVPEALPQWTRWRNMLTAIVARSPDDQAVARQVIDAYIDRRLSPPVITPRGPIPGTPTQPNPWRYIALFIPVALIFAAWVATNQRPGPQPSTPPTATPTPLPPSSPTPRPTATPTPPPVASNTRQTFPAPRPMTEWELLPDRTQPQLPAPGQIVGRAVPPALIGLIITLLLILLGKRRSPVKKPLGPPSYHPFTVPPKERCAPADERYTPSDVRYWYRNWEADEAQVRWWREFYRQPTGGSPPPLPYERRVPGKRILETRLVDSWVTERRVSSETRPHTAGREIVVLVERHSEHSHHGTATMTLLEHLEQTGAQLTVYIFHNDPTSLVPLRRTPDGWRLEATAPATLDGFFPHEHRQDVTLFLFSQGAHALRSPVITNFDLELGESVHRQWIAPWFLPLIEDWQGAVLLTPKPEENWDWHESVLAEFILIEPASRDGIRRALKRTQGSKRLKGDRDVIPRAIAARQVCHPLPPVEQLTHNPVRTQAETQGQVQQLQAFLGEDAFLWLCCIAVAPEVRWDVSIWLGHLATEKRTLSANTPPSPIVREANLLKLLALPWFRMDGSQPYSVIPPGLRQELIDALRKQDEKLYREISQAVATRLLLNSPEGPRDDTWAHATEAVEQAIRVAYNQPDAPIRVARNLVRQYGLEAARQLLIGSQWEMRMRLTGETPQQPLPALRRRLQRWFWNQGAPALGMSYKALCGIAVCASTLAALVLALQPVYPPLLPDNLAIAGGQINQKDAAGTDQANLGGIVKAVGLASTSLLGDLRLVNRASLPIRVEAVMPARATIGIGTEPRLPYTLPPGGTLTLCVYQPQVGPQSGPIASLRLAGRSIPLRLTEDSGPESDKGASFFGTLPGASLPVRMTSVTANQSLEGQGRSILKFEISGSLDAAQPARLDTTTLRSSLEGGRYQITINGAQTRYPLTVRLSEQNNRLTLSGQIAAPSGPRDYAGTVIVPAIPEVMAATTLSWTASLVPFRATLDNPTEPRKLSFEGYPDEPVAWEIQGQRLYRIAGTRSGMSLSATGRGEVQIEPVTGQYGEMTLSVWSERRTRAASETKWTLGRRELDRTEEAVRTLVPRAEAWARAFLQRLRQEGINAQITAGTRTFKDQDILYARGRTQAGVRVTNARGGYSSHNFGIAWDISIYSPSGALLDESSDYTRAGQIGKSLGLEWGGDYSGFPDKPHFQVKTNKTIAELRAIVLANGGDIDLPQARAAIDALIEPVEEQRSPDPSYVGRRFSPQEFRDYLRTSQFTSDFRPTFVVLHHTASPTLAERPNGFTESSMRNLWNFYTRKRGFKGAPHIWIDQNGIWVLQDVNKQGTHSTSFNQSSIGVELLGDYDKERLPDSIGDNAVAAVAAINEKLGVSADSLKLHKEDPRVSTSCPGRNVDRADFIRRVAARMRTPTPTPTPPPAQYPALRNYIGQMRSMPGGTFQMGNEKGYASEMPVHSVTLSPFSMGRTPVTVAVWKEYVAANKLRMPTAPQSNPGWRRDDYPMLNISWEDVMGKDGKGGFCAWATQVSGQSLTLPTEAQWEYAARGGLDGREYPWGDTFESSRVWFFQATGQNAPGAVTRRENIFENGYGLLDMVGNVWQMCRDWYDAGFYQSSEASKDNPTGPAVGKYHVVRGGSWSTGDSSSKEQRFFRCSFRWSDGMVELDASDLGFRLVSPGQ